MTPEPSNEAVDLTEEDARMVLADELQACFPKRAEQCRNGLCDPEIPLQEAVDAMICFARRAALSALKLPPTVTENEIVGPRDVLHEILLAQLRSVFASAYAFRLRQGWTDAEMAERACWDVRTFRNLMLAPRRMSIRDVGLMAFAFDVELDFKLVPRASGIAARSDETAQQGSGEASTIDEATNRGLPNAE